MAGGEEVELWPYDLEPKMDVNQKVHGNSAIFERSVFVISGQNIFMDSHSLDGALIVSSVDEAEVRQT